MRVSVRWQLKNDILSKKKKNNLSKIPLQSRTDHEHIYLFISFRCCCIVYIVRRTATFIRYFHVEYTWHLFHTFPFGLFPLPMAWEICIFGIKCVKYQIRSMNCSDGLFLSEDFLFVFVPIPFCFQNIAIFCADSHLFFLFDWFDLLRRLKSKQQLLFSLSILSFFVAASISLLLWFND